MSTQEKKNDKILIHFVMQLRNSRFFCLARGVLLDKGVQPPWVGVGDQMLICVQNGQEIGDNVGVYGKSMM